MFCQLLKKKQEEKNLGTENFHLEKNNALSLPLKQSVNLSAVEITMNDETPSHNNGVFSMDCKWLMTWSFLDVKSYFFQAFILTIFPECFGEKHETKLFA